MRISMYFYLTPLFSSFFNDTVFLVQQEGTYMSKPTAKEIRIAGLTKLDRAELSEGADTRNIRFEDEQMPGEKHGELLATAVVLITVAGLHTLGAYLLRTQEKGRIRKTVEVVDSRGRRITETVEVDISKSKAPKASVLKELAKLTGIDASQLLEGEN
jgi:hypothetical protein